MPRACRAARIPFNTWGIVAMVGRNAGGSERETRLAQGAADVVAEATDAGTPPFHDFLVELFIEGNGIFAIVAGHAKGRLGKSCGTHHAGLRKITEGIGLQVISDFLQRVLHRQELVAIWEIDAIDTGVFVWRATDQDVHLFGTGVFEGHDSGSAGSAADNRVIDDDDSFAGDKIFDEVQLHLYGEVADTLGGLQEAAADIVVSDESHLVGDAAFQRVPQSGTISRVGHRDDDVCLDGVFTGQFSPHFDADLIDVSTGDGGIWPGKVDVLKDAKSSGFLLGERVEGSKPVFVDDHNFARADVANEFGFDEVERAGFAGEDPAAGGHSAQAERAEPVRISDADQFSFGHDDEGEGAFDAADSFDEDAIGAIA